MFPHIHDLYDVTREIAAVNSINPASAHVTSPLGADVTGQLDGHGKSFLSYHVSFSHGAQIWDQFFIIILYFELCLYEYRNISLSFGFSIWTSNMEIFNENRKRTIIIQQSLFLLNLGKKKTRPLCELWTYQLRS